MHWRASRQWHPATAHVVAAIAALALADLAFAQNSLFRRNHQPARPVVYAPTSQPAAGDAPVVIIPPTQIRGRLAADPYAEAPNPVLRRYSPIAVEAPQQEEIEVNDLLTIIVREVKSSSSDSKLESQKDWKVEAALNQWFRLDPQDRLVPQNFTRAGTPGVDFDFKGDYQGEGKVDRKDTLTTRITARVIDVKPNGTLTLEASKQVAVDEEKYTTTLTGQCRSEDVTAQNTVLSTQVHDLRIDVQHTGAARDAARRGWLMRLFDFLRPI